MLAACKTEKPPGPAPHESRYLPGGRRGCTMPKGPKDDAGRLETQLHSACSYMMRKPCRGEVMASRSWEKN